MVWTLKVSRERSACPSAAYEEVSWSFRIRLSSESFWRFSSAATSTNRSAIAFRVAGGADGIQARQLEPQEAPLLREDGLQVVLRLSAASRGVRTRKRDLPAGAELRGARRPFEADRRTDRVARPMPRWTSFSPEIEDEGATVARDVEAVLAAARRRASAWKPAKTALSAGSFGSRYSCCRRTTSSSTTNDWSRSTQEDHCSSSAGWIGPVWRAPPAATAHLDPERRLGHVLRRHEAAQPRIPPPCRRS